MMLIELTVLRLRHKSGQTLLTVTIINESLLIHKKYESFKGRLIIK